jgi:HSP20 family protein
MNKKQKSDDETTGSTGIGTMIQRLGGLVSLLSDLAEKGETLQRSGEIKTGEKGMRAVYGFTVQLGGGKPSIQPFGNVKEGTAGKGPVVEETREPMVDVFDEGDHVLVVAELPGVTGNDVQFEAKDDILTLSASRGERKYRKEVLLPFAVTPEGVTPSFQNGVFELRLPRAK